MSLRSSLKASRSTLLRLVGRPHSRRLSWESSVRALNVVAVSFVSWERTHERTDGAGDPADGEAPRAALRPAAALA